MNKNNDNNEKIEFQPDKIVTFSCARFVHLHCWLQNSKFSFTNTKRSRIAYICVCCHTWSMSAWMLTMARNDLCLGWIMFEKFYLIFHMDLASTFVLLVFTMRAICNLSRRSWRNKLIEIWMKLYSRISV